MSSVILFSHLNFMFHSFQIILCLASRAWQITIDYWTLLNLETFALADFWLMSCVILFLLWNFMHAFSSNYLVFDFTRDTNKDWLLNLTQFRSFCVSRFLIDVFCHFIFNFENKCILFFLIILCLTLPAWPITIDYWTLLNLETFCVCRFLIDVFCHFIFTLEFHVSFFSNYLVLGFTRVTNNDWLLNFTQFRNFCVSRFLIDVLCHFISTLKIHACILF